jgi:hypothetical protein
LLIRLDQILACDLIHPGCIGGNEYISRGALGDLLGQRAGRAIDSHDLFSRLGFPKPGRFIECSFHACGGEDIDVFGVGRKSRAQEGEGGNAKITADTEHSGPSVDRYILLDIAIRKWSQTRR